MKVTKGLSYSTWVNVFDRIDQKITHWMARNGLFILRIGLGVIFLWFGALKLFPGLSPAEDLVRKTTYFVDPDWFVPVLALWEMSIGSDCSASLNRDRFRERFDLNGKTAIIGI